MNRFVFSPSESRFYAIEWQADYVDNNCWPHDAINVSDSIYYEFSGTPPTGKQLITLNNMPAWGDIPPLTHEQITANAMQQKTMLLAEASAVIGPLKDASDGGYIDDADRPILIAWQKYRYDLTKVDPAKPVWPTKPTE